MADDYSLDPFQVEEDELKTAHAKALAKTLRPKWDQNDPFGSGAALSNYYQSDRKLADVERQKAELAERVQRQMVETLRGVPEDLRNMVMNPGTRAEGVKNLAKYRDQEMQYSKLNEMRSQYGPGITGGQTIGAGDTGDNPYGLARAASENPHTATIGKQMMDNMTADPTKVRMDRSGNASAIPGATAALTQIEDAKMRGRDDLVDYKMPDGQIVKQPRSWVENEMRKYQTGAAPGAPPSSSLPPPSGGPPATALPGAVGAAVSGPNMPVSAPPSGGSALPGATTAAFGQPQAQTSRIALLQEEFRDNMQLLERAKATGDQQGIQTATQNLRALDQEIKLVQKQNGPTGGQVPSGMAAGPPQQGQPPMPQGQPPMPQDQPPMPPPQRVAPPGGAPGVGPSPFGNKVAEANMTREQKQLADWEESTARIQDTKRMIQQLGKVNEGPTNSGFMVPGGNVANYIASGFGAGGSPRVAGTRKLESGINELVAPLTKMLGANPSNRDLDSALKRLPTLEDDPKSRAAVINQLLAGIEYHEFTIKPIMDAMTAGASLPEATQYADRLWQQEKAKSARPTEGAGGSALPSTMSAAQMKIAHGADKAEGGGGFGEFMKDVGRNAASLPSSLFSQAGWEGMKDSYGNIITGARQLGGMDRSGWEAENKRQEERRATDKAYDQARTFHDIANPTAMAGGTSAGIARNAGAAVLQGVLQPNSTLTGQLQSGIASGALGTAGAAAGKVIPTTHPNPSLGPDAQAILDQYPNLAKTVTSAQLNPDYLGSRVAEGLGVNRARDTVQQKALTKDLLAKTLPGATPEVMSRETITKALDDFSKEYKTLLPATGNQGPGTATISIRQSDQAKMSSAIAAMPRIQDMFGKNEAPTLAKIGAMLDPKQTTTRKIVDAATMHEAWKEIGKVATGPQEAKAVRKVLEDMITQVMPNNDIKHFKDLNQRYGDFQDMERIWSQGGGGGKASARGTILPAKLEAEAGRGPNPGSATDQAMDVVNMLRMGNARNKPIGEAGIGDIAGRIVQDFAGPMLSYADRSATQSSPGVKKMLELLRAATVRGGPRLGNEMFPGAQDAP